MPVVGQRFVHAPINSNINMRAPIYEWAVCSGDHKILAIRSEENVTSFEMITFVAYMLRHIKSY